MSRAMQIAVCARCGRRAFPPRLVCARCGGREWRREATERGVIEARTDLSSEEAGVKLVSVRMEGGPLVVARLCGAADLGQAVLLGLEGRTLVARPVEGQAKDDENAGSDGSDVGGAKR